MGPVDTLIVGNPLWALDKHLGDKQIFFLVEMYEVIINNFKNTHGHFKVKQQYQDQ